MPDLQSIRSQFPALKREVSGRPAIFLDGPAGSQVPQGVIDAVGRYLADFNANGGGVFATSRESDEILSGAHHAVADLLGTDDPDEVVFGVNMTSLTLALSRALALTWKPGDEILVTRMDHDANVTPWVLAARDAGAMVRHVDFDPVDFTLDRDDFRAKLSSRTKLLALACASNAVGTVHPIREMVDLVHEAGGQVFLDAVHYAPHRLLDVTGWDCDYLSCSAYKFFGPHVGILWGRRQLLESLPVYKLRPTPDELPYRWMTGTQNHEGIAGTAAAVDYLAGLGRELRPEVDDRRELLRAAYGWIEDHEGMLADRLLRGLAELPDLRVWGMTDPLRKGESVPTVSITSSRRTPLELATALAERGIFVWHGNFYALPLTEALGLEPAGLVRLGILHYNTAEEIDRVVEALRDIG